MLDDVIFVVCEWGCLWSSYIDRNFFVRFCEGLGMLVCFVFDILKDFFWVKSRNFWRFIFLIGIIIYSKISVLRFEFGMFVGIIEFFFVFCCL